MRMVLAAICLIVLLALGWVLKGLMSDHTEREFAVHYSWIVKWALTLSRESHRVPDNASFSSPRIEVAGNPNRWMLTGRLTWRDADGQAKDEPYTAVVANTCKAYADPSCWRLDDFASGAGALDLAEAAINAPAPEPTNTSPAPATPPSGQNPTVAEQQPAAPAKQPDAVLSLLEESPPDRSDGAVPEAPSPPLSEGVPVPERKPSPPSRVAEADTQLALSQSTPSQSDSLAAIEEPANASATVDTGPAIADSGAIAPDTDRTAATGSANAANAMPEAANPASPGDQDSDVALAPDQVAGTGPAKAAVSTEPAPEPVTPSPAEAASTTTNAAATAPAGPPPAAPATSSEPATSTQAVQTAAAEPVAIPTVKPTPAPPPPQPVAAAPAAAAAANPAPAQSPTPQTVAAAPAPAVPVPPAKPVAAPAPQPVAAAPTQPSAAPQPAPQPTQTATAVPPEPEIHVATATPALPPAKSEGEPAPDVANGSLAALPSDTTEPAASAFPDATHDPALIVLIQDRLNRAGYDAGLIDGRFGARTQRALMVFQREAGLPVDGQPSTTVLAALDERLTKKTAAAQPAPAPSAPKASQPAAATTAAQALPLPAAAAPQPQQQQPQVAALPPSPPAAQPAPPPAPAPQQRTATAPAPAAEPAPAPSTAGQPVSLTQPEATPTPATSTADESLIFLIQNRLRQAGYSPGRYDGRMDEGTANAIRAYQARKKLPVNGIPSRALLERLESELRPNAQPAPTPLGFNSCVPGAGVDCAIHPA